MVAAQLQFDKHVVKMTLETAQLLCSAVNLAGGTSPYKTTHKNHPSAVWARSSKQNFEWLVLHGLALSKEYTYRYNKVHACEKVIADCSRQSALFPDLSLLPFAQAMPDEYKNPDPVAAYRAYCVGAKADMAAWIKRPKPDWFQK